jgi:nucleoid-associated protein YgaU
MVQLRNTSRFIVALALVAVVASGCSRTKGRQVDVSAGDYYSQEEYEALSNGEKKGYAVALEQELGMLQGHADERRDELTATRQQIESLRSQITPIERELLRIESDIRSLTSQVTELEALPQNWNIQSGECLWLIAGYEEVYSDPIKWPRIYRANTDKIEDPEWIYPDTVLVIPRHWPRQHEVALDESLSIIAGYWEVYGDPMAWTKLYEANKDVVIDPNRIELQQLLTIPR